MNPIRPRYNYKDITFFFNRSTIVNRLKQAIVFIALSCQLLACSSSKETLNLIPMPRENRIPERVSLPDP